LFGELTQEVAVMSDSLTLLENAQKRLRRLSSSRLRVANDFLAYLEDREESEATQELLSIPDFKIAFQEAVDQSESGEVVSFKDVMRDV